MRASSWLHEAFEDTRTGASHPWLWGIALFLVVGAVSGLDVWSIARVSTGASEFQDSGSSVWITQNTDEIDPGTCDGLGGIESIGGSGALASTTNTRLAVMPNTPVPTYRVSPGFAELIDSGAPQPVPPGVLMSQDLASSIHATEGSTFESNAGSITIDAIYAYPEDGRLPSLQSAILIVDDERTSFDACWYEVWPFSETAAGIGVLAANDPTTAERTQLNSRNGINYDVAAELDVLKIEYLLGLALVAAVLVGWGAVATRRSELASTLHSTVARADLTVIVVIETLLWALPAVVGAWAGSSIAADAIPAGPVSVAPASTGIAAIALGGVLAGVMLASFTVRPNRLFTYLRDRR